MVPAAEPVADDMVRVRAVGAVDTPVEAAAAVFFIGVEMLGDDVAPAP